MTTFSSLSHWKRLPRATGAVNFDIERGRAAPSRQESVAVAAPRSHSRRDAITHAAASDCAGRACGGAALACQLRPWHQRAQGIDRHSLSGALAAESYIGVKSMATTLSPRRLWIIYKRTSVAHGTGGKRDLGRFEGC
jgi:hypothetical protein